MTEAKVLTKAECYAIVKTLEWTRNQNAYVLGYNIEVCMNDREQCWYVFDCCFLSLKFQYTPEGQWEKLKNKGIEKDALEDDMFAKQSWK